MKRTEKHSPRTRRRAAVAAVLALPVLALVAATALRAAAPEMPRQHLRYD